MLQEPGPEKPMRQIYASVSEDIYLAAKARAAELRIPLRRFLEQALELALSGAQPTASGGPASPAETPAVESVWEDEYLGIQARQPVGNPVVLSQDEAERVLREFGGGPGEGGPSHG